MIASNRSQAVLPLVGAKLSVIRNHRMLLNNVNVDFDSGGVLSVIMGHNGAGKSLLLRVLANLIEPTKGRVTWAGSAPDRARAPQIGFVFQRPIMLRRSVRANLAFALATAGVARNNRTHCADKLLAVAGLSGLDNTPARVLSAGEQQQLAIVRALATNPDILLLDEPTAALDPTATLSVERLITQIRRRDRRLILVTHDAAQARRLSDEVLFLHVGQLVERAPAERFFAAPRTAVADAFLAGHIEATTNLETMPGTSKNQLR